MMALTWTVLHNRRGEYGIYPAGRPAPGGWALVGTSGTVEECRRWLEERALADGPGRESVQ